MKTFAYISALSSIVPAIAGIIKFRYANRPLRLITMYFLLCLAMELLAIVMSFWKLNNNLIGDFFYMVEGIMLISYFYMVYNEREFMYPAIILSCAYIIYGLYTSFVDPGPDAYNSSFRAGESLIIQALAAYALIRISREVQEDITANPLFWITCGFLIYYSVNLAVFFTATFLVDDQIYLMKNTWFIHSIVNITANLVFTFGLICIPSRQPR